MIRREWTYDDWQLWAEMNPWAHGGELVEFSWFIQRYRDEIGADADPTKRVELDSSTWEMVRLEHQYLILEALTNARGVSILALRDHENLWRYFATRIVRNGYLAFAQERRSFFFLFQNGLGLKAAPVTSTVNRPD